ncbi:hypothetical protein [Geminocystis herdmanii]|uniref:hypothetical protein n=1 Tax=Geminocystis herdmanii TaxID=669359 RepID=UPI000348F23D|nr:hypothetical protein [Geminocystis herdmanii]
MKVSEFLPQLNRLSRMEKLKIIEFLASSLAEDEQISELKPNTTYPIWSPFDSHSASHQLASLLQEEQSSENA